MKCKNLKERNGLNLLFVSVLLAVILGAAVTDLSPTRVAAAHMIEKDSARAKVAIDTQRLRLFGRSFEHFTSGTGTDSIYTAISFDDCEIKRTLKIDGFAYSVVADCAGIAGFKLELVEVDERQTVNVIYPDGKEQKLNMSKVVSPSFSTVGEKAEWRIRREGKNARPIALILRYTFTVNPAISSDEASYLTVSKITDETTCVTDIVDSRKDQNEEARRLAESAITRPCLSAYPWHEDDRESN